jgi:hypothetical protein
MIQKCIILESNLEFEHAKGPTCLKYLHSSTGILSLIISQLQRSSSILYSKIVSYLPWHLTYTLVMGGAYPYMDLNAKYENLLRC